MMTHTFQSASAFWLSETGTEDPRVIAPLVHLLDDEHVELRLASGLALGRLGDARAVKPLLEFLHHDEDWVREEAAGLLGDLRDPRAVDALVESLSDPNVDVRLAAGGALIEFGDSRSVSALLTDLLSGPGIESLIAADLLGKSRDERAVGPLIELLKDEEPYVRDLAAATLGQLGHPAAVEAVVQAHLVLDPDDFVGAYEAIKDLARTESARQFAVDILIDHIDFHPLGIATDEQLSPDVLTAVILLGELGDQRAITALTGLLYERLDREFVAIALAKLNAFSEQSVRTLVVPRRLARVLLPTVSEVDTYHHGLLFCVQTIAESGLTHTAIALLEAIWRWRYIEYTDSFRQVARQVSKELSDIGTEGLNSYTLLLASVLANNGKRFEDAYGWAELGLERAFEGDGAIRTALSIVATESLVGLEKVNEAYTMIKALESNMIGRLSLIERSSGATLAAEERIITMFVMHQLSR